MAPESITTCPLKVPTVTGIRQLSVVTCQTFTSIKCPSVGSSRNGLSSVSLISVSSCTGLQPVGVGSSRFVSSPCISAVSEVPTTSDDVVGEIASGVPAVKVLAWLGEEACIPLVLGLRSVMVTTVGTGTRLGVVPDVVTFWLPFLVAFMAGLRTYVTSLFILSVRGPL